MPTIAPAALERERLRGMRPNAHRFIRPDWRRHTNAGSDLWSLYECFERKYSRDQPRVPSGSREGGQWTDAGGGQGGYGGGRADANIPANAKPTQFGSGRQVAQAGFGRLIAEIPVPGGRRCVYSFGTISVVVPGPGNFHCPPSSPLAGTTHGYLLNDNRAPGNGR